MNKSFNQKKVFILIMMIFLLAIPVVAQEIEKPYGMEIAKVEVLTTTMAYAPVRYEMGRVIRESWNKLGLNVELVPLDYKAVAQRIWQGKRFDTCVEKLSGTPLRIDPDIWMYGDFHSSGAGLNGRNVPGWINKEYDALIEESRRELNIEKRRQIIWKAQKFLYDHQPANILINDDNFLAYNYKNFEDPVNSLGSGIIDIWANLSFTPVGERKVLKAGVARDIKSINPVAVDEHIDMKYLTNIYDTLVRPGPDGAVANWAAKEIKQLNDKTYDVVLRKDMRFHDGKPVTVEDVKFTFDYLEKWKSPFYLSLIREIKEVKILKEDVVRFELKNPFPAFVVNTLGTVLILPKHIWKDVPEKAGVSNPLFWENASPVGSGPFKFKSWKRGESIEFVKNREHFHPPKIDGIIWIIYGSVDAFVGAVEKGDLDLTGYFIQPFQAARLLKTGFIKVPPSTSFGFCSLYYNTRKAPFNDMHFRRALSFAIPRTQIRDEIFEGKAALGGPIIASTNKLWHNPNIPPFPESIDKAKQELRDAGYTWDKEGKLHYPNKQKDGRFFDSGPGL